MPLHAIENIDDALIATRSFLWPIDRSLWAKLAFIMIFIGGPTTNTNLFEFNLPLDTGPAPTNLPSSIPSPGPRLWLLLGLVVAAALLLGVAFLIIRSIMDFVLIESLRTETVRVRDYWSTQWRQGLQLFAFRIVLGLVMIATIALVASAVLLPTTGAGIAILGFERTIPVVALIVVLPFLIAIMSIIGLVNGFTTVFVVPIMVKLECSILAGWRQLLRTITAHPWQYLAYALLGLLLSIGGGILIGLAVGLAVLVLLIPFGLLGVTGYFLFLAVPLVGIGLLAIVGIAFVLTVLVIVAVARVPVVVYLRYYALLVLGDIDTDLDLIPEQRRAIREPPSGDAPSS